MEKALQGLDVTSNKIQEENTAGWQPLSPSAVQGIPWWGGFPPQTLPLDLVSSHAFRQAPQVLDSALSEAVYTGVSSSDTQTQAGDLTLLLPPAMDYVLPHTQLLVGDGMATAYANPFHTGIAAAFGVQMQPHPSQQFRMALPVEVTEQEPVYVNAKQYHGIMRRRQSRAKAESENKFVKSRKPYLHESRHLHAMRRARGCGGRFLNSKTKDQSKAGSESTRSSESWSPGADIEEGDPRQSGCAQVDVMMQQIRAVPMQ